MGMLTPPRPGLSGAGGQGCSRVQVGPTVQIDRHSWRVAAPLLLAPSPLQCLCQPCGCRQLVRDGLGPGLLFPLGDGFPEVETRESRLRELIDDESDRFCSSAAFGPGGLMGLCRN